jgi:hypothetical protein
VLDLADVVICRGIQVGSETIPEWQLVVDLVLEQEHILQEAQISASGFGVAADLVSVVGIETHITGNTLQYLRDLVSAQQSFEVVMVVDKILRPHQLSLTTDVHFMIRHPFALLSRPLPYLLRPLLQVLWIYQTMLFSPKQQIPVTMVLLNESCARHERSHVEQDGSGNFRGLACNRTG